MKATNPMIQEAMERGEDTTGLCTVRDVVAYMVDSKCDVMEMYFPHEGRKWNVEIRILHAVDVVGEK